MVPLFVAPLLVVPTELTEDTEANGLKLLESTDRIDAARHTTESTLSWGRGVPSPSIWVADEPLSAKA